MTITNMQDRHLVFAIFCFISIENIFLNTVHFMNKLKLFHQNTTEPTY